MTDSVLTVVGGRMVLSKGKNKTVGASQKYLQRLVSLYQGRYRHCPMDPRTRPLFQNVVIDRQESGLSP